MMSSSLVGCCWYCLDHSREVSRTDWSVGGGLVCRGCHYGLTSCILCGAKKNRSGGHCVCPRCSTQTTELGTVCHKCMRPGCAPGVLLCFQCIDIGLLLRRTFGQHLQIAVDTEEAVRSALMCHVDSENASKLD